MAAYCFKGGNIPLSTAFHSRLKIEKELGIYFKGIKKYIYIILVFISRFSKVDRWL